MDEPYVKTYYLDRQIEIPPHVAMAAYDDLVHPGQWLTASVRARLKTRAVHSPWAGPGYGPLRAVSTVLYAPAHRHPFVLELLPWSSRRTELGLRPVSTVWTRFPSDQVLRAGDQLLRHLDNLITAWADQPLRRAVTGAGASLSQRALPHE